MSISVIIPSRTATNLRASVSALRANQPDAQIIVVDDGIGLIDHVDLMFARDGAADLSAKIKWIDGVKPFVFARNCNLGIDAAGDDDVVLLNDDALLMTPGGFVEMQRAAREHREFGIVGAVTNITGQALQHPRKQGLRAVPHFAFVCVFIPRTTINAVGKLDERYCLDYGVEDRDYCEAVNRAGLKCGVFDWCFVDHASLRSTFRGDPRAARSFEKNAQLFREKWGVSV